MIARDAAPDLLEAALWEIIEVCSKDRAGRAADCRPPPDLLGTHRGNARRNRLLPTVHGVVFALEQARRYISANSTTPITSITKPAAVAAANDRSTLSMMPPRYRRATYPPWLRRARKVSPIDVSEVVRGDV